MGLLFNQKKPNGSIGNKKFISGRDLDRKKINEVVGASGIIGKSNRYSVSKGLEKARYGGLRQKDVHKVLQEAIDKRQISDPRKAKEVAEKLGLKGKEFTQFENRSGLEKAKTGSGSLSNSGKKSHQSVGSSAASLMSVYKKGERKETGNLESKMKRFTNPSTSRITDNPARPKTIWDLLNQNKLDQ